MQILYVQTFLLSDFFWCKGIYLILFPQDELRDSGDGTGKYNLNNDSFIYGL